MERMLYSFVNVNLSMKNNFDIIHEPALQTIDSLYIIYRIT